MEYYLLCAPFPASMVIECNAHGKMFQVVPGILIWFTNFLEMNIKRFALHNPEQNTKKINPTWRVRHTIHAGLFALLCGLCKSGLLGGLAFQQCDIVNEQYEPIDHFAIPILIVVILNGI